MVEHGPVLSILNEYLIATGIGDIEFILSPPAFRRCPQTTELLADILNCHVLSGDYFQSTIVSDQPGKIKKHRSSIFP